MAAVKEFTLPDLGEGLTEAEIVRWLVEVGEVVAVDQPVVEVETAKAVVEVPCPYGGVVTARFGEEGETLAVGRPLVTVAVGSAGEPGGGPEDGDGAGGGAVADSADEGSGNVLVGYGTGPAARRRNRVRAVGTAHSVARVEAAASGAVPSANGHAVDARPDSRADQAPGGSADRGPDGGPDGRPSGQPDRFPEGGPVAVVSPLVRRLARQRGLDLRTVSGSGPEGLILRADVERALERTSGEAPTRTRAPLPGPAAVGRSTASDQQSGERIPLRGIRGAVADKLSRSRREIPDATCWVDADATELMAARAAMNTAGQAAGAERISVLALLARIVTAALGRYPDLNAMVDTARSEIVRLPAVHLGFAAQTERGLVVPVVRDAHSRTTAGLSAEIGRLTAAARDGSLTPGELTGGTFTLNNYGVFGVDGSTPIINHPEAAMLGVGRIVPKPWVHQGELAVRQVVQLSFTFDHRVCDGGTAGGFLRFVADCVESPAVLLAAV
ncbi:dihydrolipoamide acetyltransferase family protein [Streptomyces polygonati]|uniref:Dihydrolipoamide acetyltransferase component of pyruvate dehydrogenase complex n=1 Tax=Streptomyces polygonati TaxID=1617087 RepID=A0ABV8HSV5_9ACTN